MAEWGVLLLLVLVLATVFVRQVRQVQGQAELAQIKSTLGALRTALVVAHLEATVATGRGNAQHAGMPAQRNPFLALASLPANYAGVATPEEMVALPGGSWVFDPVCACVGYHPMESDRLELPQGEQSLWFQISPPPGPLQLRAQMPYVWMGQVVD
ncbi:hypothetical protein RS694_01100 [Rhodoferax saidenbachensis]|uniref:Uncharacterized protein n=1 Tax=Rhodoferax saidenbachensis TaxID=1484693 RepID=A0A1P8K5H9_9BURK|nr:hypothetical protein RS694_01100 [Rhodoferax saidenbachensis]